MAKGGSDIEKGWTLQCRKMRRWMVALRVWVAGGADTSLRQAGLTLR
ncbi:hypothetical protein [Mycobacterium sp.]|nr:hypothetical protein [Mycobacterium sp.]